MDVEFHQLDMAYAHLRVRRPDRERKLLASLAASGQQAAIVVVVATDAQGAPYRVIDGYKRIAALRRLGRDTVRVTVWDMSEAEALVLDQSLRMGEGQSALQQGWLLAELERNHGYDLQGLARQFDRSVSWVSRRLALVELLPQAVQQRVRNGEVGPHVAMKYLVPLARANVDDCRRMAEVFADQKFSTRQAGELYAAWRGASLATRPRILAEPKLFLKARSQVVASPVSDSPVVELLRDLEMVLAITSRAGRRLSGALALLDRCELEHARRRLERAADDLNHLVFRLKKKEDARVEPKPTHGDSGTAFPGGEETRDCPSSSAVPPGGAQSDPLRIDRTAFPESSGEGRSLPAANPGALRILRAEPRARP
jgi:hypothetical protein